MSLARTQSLLTRGANAGVCLRGMLDEEIAAQTPAAAAYRLQGEDVLLPPKAAEVLSLAIHELASNALRHGALTHEDGRIEVTWDLQVQAGQPWLGLHWCERHAEVEDWEQPRQRGLGRALIEQRVPYELAGSGELRFARRAWMPGSAFRCASETACCRPTLPARRRAVPAGKVHLSPIGPNWA